MAEALADVLGTERLGVEDNFFEAGGNSLLAVQARARLRPVLGEDLSLVDIFRYPTVRALAAAHGTAADRPQDRQIEQARAAGGRRAAALARQARARRDPKEA
ncbi:hypothetical protein GCM10025734_25080 [Kitasatospora paranensis]|uniref:phosphopantetheine-binding protein n=1 Tax=Kitasatospora paranensis TaxID=258053 RepID=UPI0031EB505F